jgi:hypothetical protein
MVAQKGALSLYREAPQAGSDFVVLFVAFCVPADQKRRCVADHPEPLYCTQKNLLFKAPLPAAAQDRELLLPDQRLAAYRHPL